MNDTSPGFSLALAALVNTVSAVIAKVILSLSLTTAVLVGLPVALVVGALNFFYFDLEFPSSGRSSGSRSFLGGLLGSEQFGSEDLTQLRRAGIVSAFESLRGSGYEPAKCISRTDRSLYFMGMLGYKWVTDPETHEAFKRLLSEFDADEGEVKFLIADPDSEGYRRLGDMRKETLSNDAGHYHKYVELVDDYDCLEVRLYSQIPTFRMVFIDDQTLVASRYRYRPREDIDTNRAWENIPHVEIERDAPWSMYDPFEKVFKELWEDAEPITNRGRTDLNSFH